MALYFYLIENDVFVQQIQPALAASWQQRSFQPCRDVCHGLVPAARTFAQRYHLGAEESLIERVARDLRFDRTFWRSLVGEILMIAAVDIPEIETAPDTLCCLLAPEHYRAGSGPRERYAPIQQAHFGSRDLLFGGGFYRPEHAGWNNDTDVERLCAYLAGIDPAEWTGADLAPHRELAGAEERAEELEIARAWFPALRDLYQHAREHNLIVACEIVG